MTKTAQKFLAHADRAHELAEDLRAEIADREQKQATHATKWNSDNLAAARAILADIITTFSNA